MLSEIVRLTDHELDLFLDALALGTIQPGTGLQQIRKAGLGMQAERLLSWLPEASRRFGTIEGMIAAIRLVRDERRRAAEADSRPELILTGPDVQGMTSRDTRVVVRELFESARKSVLLVGYAFHGSGRIFEPLAHRMAGDPDLAVTIVVNVHPDRDRSPEQTVRKFSAEFLRSSWPFHPKPELYYFPGSLENQGAGLASVHAKLIVLDARWVYLGSANFTTAAFQRNLEAGLRLRSEVLGRQLTGYFHRLIHEGYLRPLPID
ncbi:DISARM system phospholipase D-like protein DrmC [Singulisphaera sp. Ch08]|uniref:DISARM system phospholipase D-like protein DrmC n=1 Tax=Singulisphaera sp. Ch08 TaxID=3120278 RepID=A0AAU7CA98_9BACT